MADIRINALATTAASTASDDFVAVDGSANGTRKLNAFSPTFGGNLTVSGTGTSSIGGNTKIGNPANANQRLVVDGAVAGVGAITTNTGLSGGYLYSDGGTGGVVAAWNGGNYSALSILGTTVTIGTGASGTTAATITSTGNLTVNGTASSFGGFANAGGAVYVRKDSGEVFRADAAGAGYRIVADQNGVDLGGATTTVGGNLTVSGTSYNYVGGNKFFRGFTNYNVLYTGATELSINNQADGANLASFKNNGNFLIGTAIDGGQKLQVSGTAAFTGNVSIGNSSTTTTVRLALDGVGTTGNVPVIQFKSAGAAKGYVGLAGGFLGTTSTDMLVATDAAGAAIQFIPGDAAITALTLDSSRNATFAGSIAIGNTVQTAASVASTHKVTISIGGSTYYLLATNV